ncbi:hypothetical protein PF005_g19243 [Phytophthora fragariae]|uniref:Secreted protein n=2 Tax=Phytophthora TaxID=4783 RepID=A0A6A3SS41_9STRA|nr:hypothetical protein PF003_g40500 [Phytophthora fragariae]KAE8985358.1 hypothetical protein PR002_g22663 [Phytophthora rubi]KAE8931553.1 hypothetical protein PF009_g18391 [Phytophthora fragariae]KAE8988178.1 hypothetical protein PR001_g22117 [Phytophthora rubi]KAE8990492.1 hypothetical protein PF011_g18335 [Phytophthora fragariae]
MLLPVLSAYLLCWGLSDNHFKCTKYTKGLNIWLPCRQAAPCCQKSYHTGFVVTASSRPDRSVL